MEDFSLEENEDEEHAARRLPTIVDPANQRR
jgi:hypothetical protein